MEYATYCDELAREGERFIALARRADVAARVPSCPAWRVGDLLAHVGLVHRWAEHLVRVRARGRISNDDMGLVRGPVDAPWLAQGLASLVTTLRGSDPDDEMWAWGVDQHVRFWARRQLHETLVHRVDLEGAMGQRSAIDAALGADAIDEFLTNLGRAARFSPDVKNLVGTGEVLRVATDEGRRWSLRLDAEGFTVLEGDLAATAILRGPTDEVLPVLTRRRALDQSTCVVEGHRDLVRHWLANSALR
ncbi:MAG: maleylpyruvate isomerase family mycothiol-dependent enzyme [Acidobacteria bacterium]|nr:maleylpyruvate isomerase family mycothiol-dependent enzyme [Acidobacteriota bacterium]